MDRADSIRLLKQNAGKPKSKEIYRMPKISAKKQAKLIEEKEGTAELWDWFVDRRKDLKGVCAHCGMPSEKKNDKMFHFSICHILPKRLFASISTHPLNFVELCYYSNSCHTNFDNYILDITDLNCFDLVIERFIAMYPDIKKEERKYIPEALLQYAKNETDL